MTGRNASDQFRNLDWSDNYRIHSISVVTIKHPTFIAFERSCKHNH